MLFILTNDTVLQLDGLRNSMNYRNSRVVPGDYVKTGEANSIDTKSKWNKRKSAEDNIVKMLQMPYIDRDGVLYVPEKT